jgi:hypothetical protein
MPSIFTLEGSGKKPRKRTRKAAGLSGLDNFGSEYDSHGCKCVFNPKTGIWRKGCKNSKGQFRLKKETCR